MIFLAFEKKLSYQQENQILYWSNCLVFTESAYSTKCKKTIGYIIKMHVNSQEHPIITLF